MKVHAVLVDGVGRTREMMLPSRLPCINVPVYQPMSVLASAATDTDVIDFHVDRFDDLGRLPDGRVIYGYQFSADPQFSLWSVTASWSDIAELHGHGYLLAIDRELRQKIDALGIRPSVDLYDAVVTDEATSTKQRLVIGIARKRT